MWRKSEHKLSDPTRDITVFVVRLIDPENQIVLEFHNPTDEEIQALDYLVQTLNKK